MARCGVRGDAGTEMNASGAFKRGSLPLRSIRAEGIRDELLPFAFEIEFSPFTIQVVRDEFWRTKLEGNRTHTEVDAGSPLRRNPKSRGGELGPGHWGDLRANSVVPRVRGQLSFVVSPGSSKIRQPQRCFGFFLRCPRVNWRLGLRLVLAAVWLLRRIHFGKELLMFRGSRSSEREGYAEEVLLPTGGIQ